MNRRPSPSKNNAVRSTAHTRRREREKSSDRAKGEHVLEIVKGLFDFRKTRYKGTMIIGCETTNGVRAGEPAFGGHALRDGLIQVRCAAINRGHSRSFAVVA